MFEQVGEEMLGGTIEALARKILSQLKEYVG
jgi:hypothetical protein